jgi:hypothetical protein
MTVVKHVHARVAREVSRCVANQHHISFSAGIKGDGEKKLSSMVPIQAIRFQLE